MMSPPPLTPDLARKYYRPETKQTNDGVDPRSESNVKSFPGRMQTPFQLFYMYSIVDLQALDVLQTGVQAAPSVSGNLKTENAETIYTQRTMHLDPLKKTLLSLRLRFFCFLFLRYTCARAIPAPARSITSPRIFREKIPAPYL